MTEDEWEIERRRLAPLYQRERERAAERVAVAIFVVLRWSRDFWRYCWASEAQARGAGERRERRS